MKRHNGPNSRIKKKLRCLINTFFIRISQVHPAYDGIDGASRKKFHGVFQAVYDAWVAASQKHTQATWRFPDQNLFIRKPVGPNSAFFFDVKPLRVGFKIRNVRDAGAKRNSGLYFCLSLIVDQFLLGRAATVPSPRDSDIPKICFFWIDGIPLFESARMDIDLGKCSIWEKRQAAAVIVVAVANNNSVCFF